MVTLPRFLLAALGPRAIAVVGAVILAAGFPFVTSAATPRVHATLGARIATAPGQVIPRGNIVMRDGLIMALGAQAQVPADGDPVEVTTAIEQVYIAGRAMPMESRQTRLFHNYDARPRGPHARVR